MLPCFILSLELVLHRSAISQSLSVRRITGEGAGGLLLLISAETERGEEDPGQLANSKAAIDRFLLHFFQTFGDATASQLSLSDSINK